MNADLVSLKRWEEKVLARPGARSRVDEIEHELRVENGLGTDGDRGVDGVDGAGDCEPGTTSGSL